MSDQERISREMILETLVDYLKPLDFTHAFYEGGAAAFNRIDEWSDIDLYLVVDEDKVAEAFLVVENALASLSPIKLKIDVPQTGWQGVFQAFYKLKNTSEYLLVDFVVLTFNSAEKFLEQKMHGEAIFYFNKCTRIKLPQLDKASFLRKLSAKLEKLQARFEMFNIFVQKEINRGNSLEAASLYHHITFTSLVEALRVMYSPIHYEFKMHHINRELPTEVIEKLEHLYFVKDADELQRKYLEATKWFTKTILEINRKQISELINA